MLTCQLKKRILTEIIDPPDLRGVGIGLTIQLRNIIFSQTAKESQGLHRAVKLLLLLLLLMMIMLLLKWVLSKFDVNMWLDYNGTKWNAVVGSEEPSDSMQGRELAPTSLSRRTLYHGFSPLYLKIMQPDPFGGDIHMTCISVLGRSSASEMVLMQ
jgi:hypothetical protein